MSARADWSRVKALFQSALDLPTEERRAHVLAEAGDDAALRDEVLEMLTLHDSDAGALDGRARDLLTTNNDTTPLPERIGPYVPERVLGRGGMGVVLLARRADGQFEQRVAIKLIRGGMLDGELIARLRREREILARLAHPRIARLTDGGVSDDGLPWYAMEYIEGRELLTWCDEHALDPRARARLFLQVLDAVDYAHRNLVVHRDLKPSNILVTGAGDGEIKLLDFGIAKLIDEDEAAARTGSHLRLLTPDYAAPEQIMGEAITTATDIYALGVVLFELLSGRLPYRRVSSPARLAAAIVDEEPERLRQAISRPVEANDSRPASLDALAGRRSMTSQRLRAALDPELDQIIAIALAKRPEDRYRSAAAMSEDLRAWLEGRPLLSRPVPWTRRALKFVRRHRLAVLAALAVVVVGIVGVIATLLQTYEARRQAQTARAVRDTLTQLFSAADPTVNGGVEPTLREVLDLGAERVERDSELTPAVRVALLSDLAAVYASLGQLTRAADLYERARAGTTPDAIEPREAARLEMGLADALSDLSRLDEAEAAYARAAGYAARANDPTLDVEVRIGLAQIDEARDRAPRARERIEALIAELRASPTPRPRELANALQARGSLDLAARRGEDGLAAMRESLEQLRLAGAGELELAGAQAELARALRDSADAPAATKVFRDVVATQSRILGKDHPVTLTSRDELSISMQLSHDPQTRANFESVLADTIARFGAEHARVALVCNNFGVYLYEQRDYAAARENFERAHAIWARVLGADHERTMQANANLGGTLAELGMLDEAERALTELITRDRAAGNNGRIYSTLLTRGLVYQRQGRQDAAHADFVESLRVAQAFWPDQQRQWVWGQTLLARSERQLGHLDRARELLEDAVAHYRDPQYPTDRGTRISTAVLELSRTLTAQHVEPERALALAEESLMRRTNQFGADHADTREAADEVARLRAPSATSNATARRR